MTRRIKRALCSVLVFVLPVKIGRVMLFMRLLFSCFCSVVQKKKNGSRPLITRPVCAHQCNGAVAYRM